MIEKSLNEYQITVKGKTMGVNIPINHRLVITKGMIRRLDADNGYELWIKIETYKDGSHSVLLINDVFLGNSTTFYLGTTLPTKSIQSIIATEFEKELNKKVGIGKWQKIK